MRTRSGRGGRGGSGQTLLLAAAQALYLSSVSVVFTFSGLAGADLAPTPELATLPLALITVVTAACAIPTSLLMAKVGRRPGFQVGALIGAIGAGVAAWGVVVGDFAVFCVGNALMGAFQASAMYYRFAAADMAGAAFRAKAVAWVLAGGVVAALAGPEIAARTRHLVTGAEYSGAYATSALLALISIALLGNLRGPPAAAEDTREEPGRTLTTIMRQPVFLVAVLNAAAAYVVMSFVMTASPLAVVATGHGVDAAAAVTRWHLIGMFAPSFITGRLAARYGVRRILMAGFGLSAVSLGIALSSSELVLFKVALLLLGAGWNFLYIGGTTLLTEAYAPSERAKTQAANEFMVFGATALATLAAGPVQAGHGWAVVNIAAGPVLALAGLATAWFAWRRRKSSPAFDGVRAPNQP